MQAQQKGFSILEVILIIAVIGLIGAVAWLFVTNQHKPDDTNSTKSTQTTQTKQTKKKSTSDTWYAYTADNNLYSLKIPDGWTLHKKTGGVNSLYSTGGLTLKPGTAGKVVDTVDDIPRCDVLILDFLADTVLDDTLYAHSITTASGLTVETGVTTDELGIAGGGKTYSYSAFHNKHSVNITYTTCKNGVDNHDIVEQAVKTLAIN